MPQVLPVHHRSVPASAPRRTILVFGCALVLALLLALAAPVKGGAGLTGPDSLEFEPIGP
jgi:hypothetical protein